jgi:CheY-like chemotaxis protein
VWTRLQGIPVPKILVADDNANIQKMVVLAFEERGIQVVTVGNGEAAVRRIPDLNPDLVLADIFMPVRNGYEVCEFIKKDERFAHVPVILLVGAFDPLDEKEARRVGADGVLKKPFVPPDPLVAMVMSALEKNPKVVAEMAKAREAKEVLPPEPAAHLEIPSRAEPKPLPDFPEPTPEEAAMVYGFGKGVRALDDEQMEAAAAIKAPVAPAEEDEDDEFDGASTSSDWRRNAMDFEIPADSANKPAFSSDDDLEPTTFPSERDYPPRHVRVPEPVEEVDPVVEDAAPAPVVARSPSSSSEVFSAPLAAAEPAVTDSEPPAKMEAEPEPQTAPAVKAESKSETDSLPVSAHWMDALSPAQAQETGGGWMSSLFKRAERKFESVMAPADEPAVSHAQDSSPAEAIEAHEHDEIREAVHEQAREEAREEVRGEIHEQAHAAVEHPEAETLFPVSHAVHDEPEQPVEDTPAATESAPAESWFAPAPSVFESDRDPVSAPVAVAPSAPDHALELDTPDDAPSVALRDPGLVESPAVHVTPEPLLVDDEESHGPSEYGTRKQETTALHSFFAPASGDPVVQEPMDAETSAREEIAVPSFENSFNHSDDRIPTGPPPNREALAGIPFLTPPSDFRASTPESAAPNQGTVDEVVRRVLERLEPQIHDLLSSGVLKPLVENLLQSELAKKGK